MILVARHFDSTFKPILTTENPAKDRHSRTISKRSFVCLTYLQITSRLDKKQVCGSFMHKQIYSLWLALVPCFISALNGLVCREAVCALYAAITWKLAVTCCQTRGWPHVAGYKPNKCLCICICCSDALCVSFCYKDVQ